MRAVPLPTFGTGLTDMTSADTDGTSRVCGERHKRARAE